MSLSLAALPADDRTLPALLARAAEPVVVASHFAGWAEPWHALDESEQRELAGEFGERVRLASIETGANREFALRHGLEILPEVLVFLRGQVVARFSGRVRAAQVAAAVHAALGDERARAEAEAELAASAGGREASAVRSVLRSRAKHADGERLAHAG